MRELALAFRNAVRIASQNLDKIVAAFILGILPVAAVGFVFLFVLSSLNIGVYQTSAIIHEAFYKPITMPAIQFIFYTILAPVFGVFCLWIIFGRPSGGLEK